MAAEIPNHVTEDLTGTCWRDDMWLAAFGLHHGNVLDYFAMSPFYDRACNNERSALQGKPRSQPALGEGVEYLLADSQPPHLFILRKMYRHAAAPGGPAVSTLAFYYILDGSIYQAPSLQAALQARMQRCMYNIKAAFRDMQQDLAPLSRSGEQHEQSALERELAAGRDVPRAMTAADREQQQRVEANIRHVLRQFPLPVPAAALEPEAPAACGIKAEPSLAATGAAAGPGAPAAAAGAAAAGGTQQLMSAAASHPA